MASQEAPPSKLGDKRRLDLGWLAGSTIQPSKRKEIEGVGASTMLDLQAQLYQAQEESKARKDAGLAPLASERRRGSFQLQGAGLGGRNAGVDARNARDLTQNKTDAMKISEAYAALERKAAIYEKLARGDLDDDDERFEVDFLMKGAAAANQGGGQQQPQQPPQHQEWQYDYGDEGRQVQRRHDREQDNARAGSSGRRSPPRGGGRGRDDPRDGGGGRSSRHSDDSDSDDERRRRRGPVQPIHTAEELAEADRKQQHKEVVMQLAQQTKQQRQKAAEVKQVKEQQAATKMAKLKESFLKKALAKQLGKP